MMPFARSAFFYLRIGRTQYEGGNYEKVIQHIDVGSFDCGFTDSLIGGGGGGGSSPANVAGTWTGTWASNNKFNVGAISTTIARLGTTCSGTIMIGSSPCFSGGTITGGTVSGNTVSWSSPGIGNSSGTVSGTTITGAYSVTIAGACFGDTGTFSVT